MTTILEPDVLLLAGLDDVLHQPDGIADRIFYAVAEFNQRGLPIISNYSGSIEELKKQFRKVPQSQDELERVLRYIHTGHSLDPDHLPGIIEKSSLKEKEGILIRVGGFSFTYDKPWAGHSLLAIPQGRDLSQYEVFQSCVAEICVRAANDYSFYASGSRSVRLPPIHLFVDPQLTDGPSERMADASAVYEFLAQTALEKVFYKHTDYRFAF